MLQDPAFPEFSTEEDWQERGPEDATFMNWLIAEQTLDPGLVDPLADIIRNQLYVNPLEFLDAEIGSEVRTIYIPYTLLYSPFTVLKSFITVSDQESS